MEERPEIMLWLNAPEFKTGIHSVLDAKPIVN